MSGRGLRGRRILGFTIGGPPGTDDAHPTPSTVAVPGGAGPVPAAPTVESAPQLREPADEP